MIFEYKGERFASGIGYSEGVWWEVNRGTEIMW